MTEKDKARSLFSKMFNITFDKEDAKDCAIVVVQELIGVTKMQQSSEDYYEVVINEIKKI